MLLLLFIATIHITLKHFGCLQILIIRVSILDNSKICAVLCSLDRDGGRGSPFAIMVAWYYVRMKKIVFAGWNYLFKAHR